VFSRGAQPFAGGNRRINSSTWLVEKRGCRASHSAGVGVKPLSRAVRHGISIGIVPALEARTYRKKFASGCRVLLKLICAAPPGCRFNPLKAAISCRLLRPNAYVVHHYSKINLGVFPVFRLRLMRETIAVHHQDGSPKGVALLIPAKSEVVCIDPIEVPFDQSKLVAVEWEGKTVRVFLQDLLDRGEPVRM
jgi:hypothetical protein